MTNENKTPNQQLPLTLQGDITADDVRDIEESLKETEANQHNYITNNNYSKGEGSSVKGKDSMDTDKFGVDDFPKEKENVAFHLAIALEDEENLPYYKKLADTRRIDFLKNCLRITLEAFEKRQITKTKAKFFTGVVKNRTKEAERLEEYKRTHYFQQSLVGNRRSRYGR